MALKRESMEDRILRTLQTFDKLSASVLITEPEAAAIAGEAANTWKDRRISGEGTPGPRVSYLNAQVRYRVSDLREWLADRTKTTNAAYHEGRKRGREEKARKETAKAATKAAQR